MKYLIIVLLTFYQITACFSQDQRQRFTIDHFAINVERLDSSVAFYQKVFGLREIYDGTHQEHIRWFDLGGGQELHIIEVDDLQLQIPKGVHLALTTADIDQFTLHLRKLGIDFYDWIGQLNRKAKRPDNIEQVYIQDPDGYWVEVNNGVIRYNK